MRRIVAFVLGSLTVIAGSIGEADPVATPLCAAVAPPTVFASGQGRLENLLFDGHGNLFVSSIDGELFRFDAGGARTTLVEGETPLGGMALGPDGDLYLGRGVGPPLIASPEDQRSEVWRFSSIDPVVRSVFADGFASANGLAFDPAGNLYVAGGFDLDVWRVAPSGAKTLWATVFTANGIVASGDGSSLLIALTADPASSILEVDFADPTTRRAIGRMSAGPGIDPPAAPDPTLPVLPKGSDDLVVGPDGFVYVAAHVTGELLRIDPESGASCVMFTGMSEGSSVRVARGFGAYDGSLFVTEFGGRILVQPLG